MSNDNIREIYKSILSEAPRKSKITARKRIYLDVAKESDFQRNMLDDLIISRLKDITETAERKSKAIRDEDASPEDVKAADKAIEKFISDIEKRRADMFKTIKSFESSLKKANFTL